MARARRAETRPARPGRHCSVVLARSCPARAGRRERLPGAPSDARPVAGGEGASRSNQDGIPEMVRDLGCHSRSIRLARGVADAQPRRLRPNREPARRVRRARAAAVGRRDRRDDPSPRGLLLDSLGPRRAWPGHAGDRRGFDQEDRARPAHRADRIGASDRDGRLRRRLPDTAIGRNWRPDQLVREDGPGRPDARARARHRAQRVARAGQRDRRVAPSCGGGARRPARHARDRAGGAADFQSRRQHPPSQPRRDGSLRHRAAESRASQELLEPVQARGQGRQADSA